MAEIIKKSTLDNTSSVSQEFYNVFNFHQDKNNKMAEIIKSQRLKLFRP